MRFFPRTLLMCAALTAASLSPAAADDKPETKASPRGGIQWFATWVQAEAEAKRTQRPILLVSAAPHCKNISGEW